MVRSQQESILSDCHRRIEMFLRTSCNELQRSPIAQAPRPIRFLIE